MANVGVLRQVRAYMAGASSLLPVGDTVCPEWRVYKTCQKGYEDTEAQKADVNSVKLLRPKYGSEHKGTAPSGDSERCAQLHHEQAR